MNETVINKLKDKITIEEIYDIIKNDDEIFELIGKSILNLNKKLFATIIRGFIIECINKKIKQHIDLIKDIIISNSFNDMKIKNSINSNKIKSTSIKSNSPSTGCPIYNRC